MTVEQILKRAYSAVGKGCIYQLGKGGFVPTAAGPWDQNKMCDCSGAVAWFLGISRYIGQDNSLYWRDNGEWFSTDAIVRDAKSPFGFVEQIEKPRPGCLIVFPKLTSGGYGHVGLVTSGDTMENCKVIHCSAGNYSKTLDAIRETDSSVFRKPQTIFAWCAFVEEGQTI